MEIKKIEDETYIYGLLDGDIVRYIGKSDNPNKTLRAHISESINGNNKTHKCNWINKMIADNKEIGIKILETVSINNWEKSEKYW